MKPGKDHVTPEEGRKFLQTDFRGKPQQESGRQRIIVRRVTEPPKPPNPRRKRLDLLEVACMNQGFQDALREWIEKPNDLRREDEVARQIRSLGRLL